MVDLGLHTPNVFSAAQILVVMGMEWKQLLQLSRLPTHTKSQEHAKSRPSQWPETKTLIFKAEGTQFQCKALVSLWSLIWTIEFACKILKSFHGYLDDPPFYDREAESTANL